MSDDFMSVMRANFTVSVKKVLGGVGAYKLDVDRTKTKTTINLTHPDSPGWTLKLEIVQSAQDLRCLLDGCYVTSNNTNVGMRCVRNRVDSSRRMFDMLKRSVGQDEVEAKQWLDRQEREVGDLEDLPWLDLQIITSGPYAGRYHARLEAGNPLEFMTLAQVKELHQFLVKCKGNRK